MLIDPIKDFMRRDAKQAAELAKLPKCCICGEPIQDEYGYQLGVDWYDEKCFNDEYRKYIEIEELTTTHLKVRGL